MARGLGTVFVELSLDDKVYKQKLSETLTSTTATAKGIEKSWQVLGTRAGAAFDAQRRSYQNAMTLIKNADGSTKQDIIRAQEAMNSKIRALNEQQFGSGPMNSMFDKMKANWLGISAGIYGAVQALSEFKEMAMLGAKVIQIEEAFHNLSITADTDMKGLVESMREATARTVDESDLMQKAIKGITQGLSSEDMVKIGEIARVTARTEGIDVSEAFERVADALANKMPKALKTMGVITDEQMRVVKAALAAGVEDANLLTFAYGNALIKTEQLAASTDNLSEAFQRQKAQVKDMREDLAKLAAEAWNAAMGFTAAMYAGAKAMIMKPIDEQQRNAANANIPYTETIGMETPVVVQGGRTLEERKAKIESERIKQSKELQRLRDATEAAKNKGGGSSVDQETEAMEAWLLKAKEMDPWLDEFKKKKEALAAEAAKLTRKFGEQKWITEGLNTALKNLDLQKLKKDLEEVYKPAEDLVDLERVWLDAIEERNAALDKEVLDKYKKSIADISEVADHSKDTVNDFADLFKNKMSSMADAITEFCLSGKLDFSNMVNSMMADLMKLYYKQLMFGQGEQGGGLFEKALGWLGFGESKGVNDMTTGWGVNGIDPAVAMGPAFHGGGVIGYSSPSFYRAVPAGIFNNAPRFHSGLASDEFPAILQKGETVIPKGGSASPNVNVVINNNNGSQVTQTSTPDGNGGVNIEVMIDTAVAKQLSTYGSQSNKALRNNYGTQQTLISR